MIIKLLAAITTILVISMALFVVLKVNFEENKDISISDVDKFVGKWRLINTEADEGEHEISDTTEESDNYIDYETYEFLSTGTYYHVVDKDNISGGWEINNSLLVLTVGETFGVISLSYKYIFSNDNHRVTLSIVEDPENFLEFEKINV